jgi:hypothetical protein
LNLSERGSVELGGAAMIASSSKRMIRYAFPKLVFRAEFQFRCGTTGDDNGCAELSVVI